jgi:hypothetical protein
MLEWGYSAMSDRGASKLPTAEQFKTAAVVLPVIGTSIALTYDVGYFFGIDINYFSVFSFAEHIGFALQVAPLALIVVLFSVTMTAVILNRPNDVILNNETGYIPIKNNYLVDISCAIVAILGIGLWLLSGRVFGIFGSGFAIFTYLIFIYLRSSRKRVKVSRFGISMFWLSLTTLSGVMIILTYGYDEARYYVSGDAPTHILNDETEGRLLKTGERGVLFVTKGDKQIVLFRWDGIKSIKSIKLPAEDKKKSMFERFFRRE